MIKNGKNAQNGRLMIWHADQIGWLQLDFGVIGGLFYMDEDLCVVDCCPLWAFDPLESMFSCVGLLVTRFCLNKLLSF